MRVLVVLNESGGTRKPGDHECAIPPYGVLTVTPRVSAYDPVKTIRYPLTSVLWWEETL